LSGLLHVVLAGVWIGGVVFTTFVVSPALKAMKWPGPERVLVRPLSASNTRRSGARTSCCSCSRFGATYYG
jgi:hypothetical protein